MKLRVMLAAMVALGTVCAGTVPASAAPDQFTRELLMQNDFNYDQHSNPGVFDPATGGWRIFGDDLTTQNHFGTKGDIPVVTNVGDGWALEGVFRPSNGVWYLADFVNELRSAVQFGTRGDIPVQAHYRGIDKSTVLAVFRPWTGRWFLRGMGSHHFGARGDIPVPGHYFDAAADNYADHIAVFRPRTGTWYIEGAAKIPFGSRYDIPVPADYNGDGSTDVAVFRPWNGMWYIRKVGSYHFGTRGDVPVTGDFNGDGKADIAVFRPSNGRLYIWGAGSQTIAYHRGVIPIGAAPYTD